MQTLDDAYGQFSLWMQHKSQGPGGAVEAQRPKAPGGGQIAADGRRLTWLLCQQGSWFDWKSGLNSFPSGQMLHSDLNPRAPQEHTDLNQQVQAAWLLNDMLHTQTAARSQTFLSTANLLRQL